MKYNYHKLITFALLHPIKFHAMYKLHQVYNHIQEAKFIFDNGGFAQYDVPDKANKWHEILNKKI